ncbi:hypothetical protein V2J09_015436 [Rumex salicifolius]
MASAFQALPPPGPPPPGVIYPTTVTNQPSSHSNGSFGMVFAVLAVILVISAVACVLGRLCNKRSQRGSNQPRANNNNSKYHNHGHDQRFSHEDDRHNLPPNGRPKERDPELGFGPNELGFDKKIPPNIKIVPREEGRGYSMGNQMPPRNGEFGGNSMGSHMPRMMESPRNFR